MDATLSNEVLPSGGDGQTDGGAAGPEKPWVLAHLSDPHIAWSGPIKWQDLWSKRILGYLRWKLRRHTDHRQSVLTRLRADLARTQPDHIVVTGDLTQLGLPVEFEDARRWLVGLGAPHRVTVVPGNHDTYVQTNWHETFAGWMDYMVSDPPYRQTGPAVGLNGLFPTLRVRGRIALIGVSTAIPSAPHLAVGGIGAPQLEKLKAILEQTAGQGLFRIVSIHHPPISGMVSWRKQLTDGSALLAVISRIGTELILHGHAHKTTHHLLNTRSGAIPVVGAPSISSPGRTRQRRAGYGLFAITPARNGWHVAVTQRIYSAGTNGFVSGEKKRFHAPASAR